MHFTKTKLQQIANHWFLYKMDELTDHEVELAAKDLNELAQNFMMVAASRRRKRQREFERGPRNG